MPEQEVICIVCPLGCRGRVITDEKNKVVKFEGYECKEGKEYAETEAEEPLRILTATVITESKIRPLLPVKTNKPISKNKLKQCMRVLAKVRVKPPVSKGHIMVPNILDTGANIVSTGEILA
jgi:CxxC motif-containing protein